MASVTGRLKEIKQPRGGYIKTADFETIVINDNSTINEEENVHASIIGLAVDYLTRLVMGTNVNEAFKISLLGATVAEEYGIRNSLATAKNLLKGIKGIDDASVVNACKIITFDVWFRNPISAALAKSYKETNPDKSTVYNIQTMVKRSVIFFNQYGPIVKDGFSFEPVKQDKNAYFNMIQTSKGSYGGYTPTVESGDGDFLTADTLWDFKVSKLKPTSNHTLQLLMYWIMGQHSGQEIFNKITKLGIFNPRLNTIYLLDMTKVSKDIIKTVENEVICYT